MMRALYISVMVLSVVLCIVSLYYISEVSDARAEQLFRMFNENSYGGDSYGSSYGLYDDRDNDLTVNAGLITLFFFLFFLAVQILTFVKMKMPVMKVLNIIGVILTVLMLAWDMLMMSSPGGISFDEVGIAWVLYGVIILAFSIIGTVQAFKKKV